MSSLLDLSGRINAVSLALYGTLSDVAGSIGISFFVIGATARDMVFEFGYGLPSKRATKDVDLGVRVASWGQFRKLKESLLASGHFTQTKDVQRLLYRGELLLDLLPFGGVVDAKNEIRWPPDGDLTMSKAVIAHGPKV